MSSLVWPWRIAGVTKTRAAAAAAARRRAALRAAITLGVAAALAFWKPWLGALVAVVSLLVLALGLASPLTGYARLEALLERFAHGVAMAVTWLLMPLTFVLLFLPVGLLLRAAGKLRLEPRIDSRKTTYWRPGHATAKDADGEGSGRWQGAGLDRYRRQF